MLVYCVFLQNMDKNDLFRPDELKKIFLKEEEARKYTDLKNQQFREQYEIAPFFVKVIKCL